MPRGRTSYATNGKASKNNGGANLGFEATLWATADEEGGEVGIPASLLMQRVEMIWKE